MLLGVLAGCSTPVTPPLPPKVTVMAALAAAPVQKVQSMKLVWNYSIWPMSFEVWSTTDLHCAFNLAATVVTNCYEFFITDAQCFYKVRAAQGTNISGWATR